MNQSDNMVAVGETSGRGSWRRRRVHGLGVAVHREERRGAAGDCAEERDVGRRGAAAARHVERKASDRGRTRLLF